MKSAIVWFLAAACSVMNFGAVACSDDRLYELRVYQPEPGKQGNLLKLIEGDGLAFTKKHGLELIAAWTPADSTDARVVTLMRHADRKTCDAAWGAMQADPDWQAAFRKSYVDEQPIVKSVSRIFLSATDFSPSLTVESVGDRIFELRTYVTTPKNLSALHHRFRDHTLTLFQRHGMTNVIYWKMADGESVSATDVLQAVSPVGKSTADIEPKLPAAGNTLIYFLAHASESAAQESFEKFRQDPNWTIARLQSEQSAGGSLTAGNGVKSWFLKPTSFSPLK
jgi:hypothetical protein